MVFHHPRRRSLATRTIVVVSLGPATLCPSRSNCVRHSPHKSQHKSLSQFLAFRSDNHTSDPFDLTLPISSSRILGHHQKTRTAPKPNCGGASLAYFPVRVRASPLRPRCCRPNRSMWKREDVVVGQCTFTHSSVLHSVTGSESGSRRRYTTHTHTARTRCALRQHCLHPRILSTRKVSTMGEGRRSHLKDTTLYTMMMSTAVLARRLIGTC